ncbi:hypothetical protein SAMD00019534_084240, partial [Acytostelium subglobosum LB1]|uniref:hypothetical protein n=1 Tax=Acytostelium subglobosum LB1 TaxID=1410327 RepID=UPI00064482AC
TNVSVRAILATIMLIVWCIRFGWFLGTRIHMNNGRDKRFDGVRDQPKTLLVYWTLQGLWITFIITPVMLLSIKRSDYVILLAWFGGLALETSADMEKRAFNGDKRNKGKWITTGLWSWSRHPNYIGEIIIQWTLYTFVVRGLPTWTLCIIALISPLFTSVYLYKIAAPMLEAIAHKQWGKDANYQAYLKSTPIL